MAARISENLISFDLVEHDISSVLLKAARAKHLVALDTETTGLEWEDSELRLVQVFVPGSPIEIVRVDPEIHPRNLVELLSTAKVTKIFHNAMFDLRFLKSTWQFTPQSIQCTKVAAKILWPNEPARQSLKGLTSLVLAVDLDKSQQTSDWSADSLNGLQLRYAANDVLYLPILIEDLKKRLADSGALQLAEDCWDHLPARAELELRHIPDPFAY